MYHLLHIKACGIIWHASLDKFINCLGYMNLLVALYFKYLVLMPWSYIYVQYAWQHFGYVISNLHVLYLDIKFLGHLSSIFTQTIKLGNNFLLAPVVLIISIINGHSTFLSFKYYKTMFTKDYLPIHLPLFLRNVLNI